jgi:acyl-CoA reductase-like NAD-dependent aldehyde dehydrogenase
MATDQLTRTTIYVDGAWIASTGTGTIEVVDSGTGRPMATVPEGTADDVAVAVAAARRAQPAWAATPVEDRRAALLRVADGIQARFDELARLMAREVGMPIAMSGPVQVGLPLSDLRATADALDEVSFHEEVGTSLVVREPVGVVGCITPWNYPLHQMTAKVGPALATGCTVVVKPSEVAPLNAFVLAEVVDAAGLPPGVFNLVCGTGPVVGEAIATHPEVDMVSFTGSTRAGTRVAELAAPTVKRLALELGGKSPYVLLDGLTGDGLRAAIENGLRKCFFNSGQTCSALTRMLVPRTSLEEVESVVQDVAARYVPGDPLDETSTLGPLVSATQRERVLRYVRTGIEEGGKVLVGGPDPVKPEGDAAGGFFVQPTVFTEVRNDMVIAQEEIFGPVLAIIPYEGEDEAVTIANDTMYGLSAGVWGPDAAAARAVALRIRAGQVEVNGGGYNPRAPFGGFKRSGFGRELGRFGLEEFLELKSLQL